MFSRQKPLTEGQLAMLLTQNALMKRQLAMILKQIPLMKGRRQPEPRPFTLKMDISWLIYGQNTLANLKQVRLDAATWRAQAGGMKTFLGSVFGCSVLLFLSACSPQTNALSTDGIADTNPPPRLTVELRDGSRVVGDGAEKSFKFRSALLGEIKLNVKDIRSAEGVSSNLFKLTTANGDSLTVSFVNSEFAVKTSFGKVDLQVNSVRKFSVTTSGMAGSWRTGLVASWPGVNEGQPSMIAVSNNPTLVSMQQTRQLSFEVWIKPNSIPREFPVILSKGGNQPGGAYGGYEFVLNAVGYDDLIFESGGCQIVTRNANGRWVNNHLGEWIFVAFTINDRTKESQFYVNGQPTKDAYNSGNNNDLNFDLHNDLYIGVPDPASNANRAKFDGAIRDVRLFNRILTANEIQEAYEAGHSD